MDFETTPLRDVFIVKPRRFGDDRGYFMETFKHQEFLEATGKSFGFVQDNFSYSRKKNTLRGLHFQAAPREQGKLVRCVKGAILDVAIDVRLGSPTFKNWIAVELTAENDKQIWVPPGFLHGFLTLLPHSEVAYKCTDYFAKETEGSVIWNDPDLAVDWGVGTHDVILSEKDRKSQSFASLDNPFVY
ncbi:MAG: dTDP-4-dehydrorhamnose 3,5-epimerase [Litorimonas sp.]